MNLDYTEVRQNLENVKAQIENLLSYLLSYMELNQTEPNRKFIYLEVYLRLADISTNVLNSERMENK